MTVITTLVSFVIGFIAGQLLRAFAGVAYINTRQRLQPDKLTPALTPATYIPDDVVISSNWEAVYRKGGKAEWIIDTNFNKIIVTISRNWRKLNSHAMWEVYIQIYGSGRRPFAGYAYVDNHIEFMEWLRKKYPMISVHSPEYINHVMESVYKAMKNPAQEVS